MVSTRRLYGVIVATAAVALLTIAGAAAHPGHQHGPDTGHLLGTGAWGNIELVSSLRVHDAAPDNIADLTVFKNYAYLAKWGAPDCAANERGGQNSPDGGAYVIDISDLANPKEVGFIANNQDTLVGEGMQGLTLNTSAYSGDVLLLNHESCGKNFKGGYSIWGITNPRKPVKLSEHAGDFTVDGGKNSPHDANTYHSVFGWTSASGQNAYLVATDNEEATDVDIFDITNPRKPVLISETDLNEFGVQQAELGLTDSFLHDMIVKRINGRDIMLVSYWDGGYILLDVTDPASPVYLSDTDYPAVDPELLESANITQTPEGNGHQGEFTLDNRFAITTDEDFGPDRLNVVTPAGNFRANRGTQTTLAQATAIAGSTVWVGRACPGDPVVPTAPLVGTSQIAVVERGLCTFEEKGQAVIAAGGYEAMLLVNREGPDACTGTTTPSLTAPIPTVLIGRNSGFAMFGATYDQAACVDDTQLQAPIAIGTLGAAVTSVGAQFDGWGYVHLFAADLTPESESLTSVDTFAIPEAHDPAFSTGFGDMSVHEVATDLTDANRAYLSYYMGGIRSLEIQCAGAAASSCELEEIGGYLDPKGNNFWGIETFRRGGQTYIAGSDMDHGLWIFRKTS
jgi:hypothetical protein